MVSDFFEIVAILIGIVYALRALGSLSNVIRDFRLKDAAVIRAEFQRERYRKLMRSGGPKTRLISFKSWPNSRKESSAS